MCKETKLQLKTSQFLNFSEKMDELPDVTDGYGLTYADFDYMDKDPERFLPFVIYLSSLNHEQYHFNEGSLSPDEIDFEINEYIKRHVELV